MTKNVIQKTLAIIIAWLKINHPELNVSDVALSDSSSGQLSSERSKASCDVLSDLLVLPEWKHVKRRGINSRVVCITESQVLDDLKAKKEKKKLNEQLKAERNMEQGRKKLEKNRRKKKQGKK